MGVERWKNSREMRRNFDSSIKFLLKNTPRGVYGVHWWWLYMVQDNSTIVLWEKFNTERLNSIFLIFILQILYRVLSSENYRILWTGKIKSCWPAGLFISRQYYKIMMDLLWLGTEAVVTGVSCRTVSTGCSSFVHLGSWTSTLITLAWWPGYVFYW